MVISPISIGTSPAPQTAGGCGCGGCGCGADEASVETGSVTVGSAATGTVEAPVPATSGMPTTTTYGVEGMTCGHCVSAVTSELGEVPGVTDVMVELVDGGVSKVTVASSGPLDLEAVRAAVDEAGYQLAGQA
jgi:copper chaperone